MLNSLENMWKNVYNLYHEDKSAIHVAYIKYLTEEHPMTEEQKNAAPETAGEVKASEEPKTALILLMSQRQPHRLKQKPKKTK